MRDQLWAVVVAAGEGRRFGGQKQFERLGGRLVVEWSVEAARTLTEHVVLVVPPGALADGELHAGCAHVVAGGATRSESVRAGLGAVAASSGIVVVHDAARPLASPALFRAVVEAVRAGADGAVPGLPVADTVKRVRDGRVVETLTRAELVAVQTPQAFDLEVLRAAHASAPEATDDAALVEGAGGRVAVVAGEARNVKLTATSDRAVLAAWLAEPALEAGAEAAR